VEKVTKEGSADFVPVAERIATFDNDGTLWCEQPIYFQGLFVFDRIKHWPPSILSGRRKNLLPLPLKAISGVRSPVEKRPLANCL
jgi:hypothetical protein